MLNLRPIVRAIPSKVVSSLASGQSNSRTFFHSSNSQSSLQQTFAPSLTSHQATVTNIINSFSFHSHSLATIEASSLQIPQDENTTYHSTLEKLSDDEFRALKDTLYTQALSTVRIGHQANFSLPKVKFENSARGSECLEAAIAGYSKAGFIEEAEFLVRYVSITFGLTCNANSYFYLLQMHLDKKSWDGFMVWFKAASKKSLLARYPWEEILTKLIDGDQPDKALQVFRVLQSKIFLKLSPETIEKVIQLYLDERKSETSFYIILHLLGHPKTPNNVTQMAVDAVLLTRGWDELVLNLNEILRRDKFFSNTIMVKAIINMMTLKATRFDQMYSLFKLAQVFDIPEPLLEQFTVSLFEWHVKIRSDLFAHKHLLDLNYFHFFLKKAVRQKHDSFKVFEVLNDMKTLGIKGREEIRTVLDVFLLNISLNSSLLPSEKVDLVDAVNSLLPFITQGSAGASPSSNYEGQAANHRILQSQDAFVCSKELLTMIENNLRPSSVAITHTLARFLTCKKYTEGLKIFRQMLPSLESITEETGFVSACGPVYNFAIRLCCRIPMVQDAQNLIQELESKGGFLDPYTSAEMIMMFQKTYGLDEAIKAGVSSLEMLKRRRAKIPPFFFNVLLNAMVEGGQQAHMWSIIDSEPSFKPSAISYGVLIKAALKDNDYDKACKLCHKFIVSDTYLTGPSMPIFCQILEHAIDVLGDKSEAFRILDQIATLKVSTNDRHDLLKLRAITELKPISLSLLLPTLASMRSNRSIPLHNLTTPLQNVIDSEDFKTASEVILFMDRDNLHPSSQIFVQVLEGLKLSGEQELFTIISNIRVKYYS